MQINSDPKISKTIDIADDEDYNTAQETQSVLDSESRFLIANIPLSLETLPIGVKIHQLMGVLDKVHLLTLKDKLRFMSFPDNERHYSVYKSSPSGRLSSKIFSVWEKSSLGEKICRASV